MRITIIRKYFRLLDADCKPAAVDFVKNSDFRLPSLNSSNKSLILHLPVESRIKQTGQINYCFWRGSSRFFRNFAVD